MFVPEPNIRIWLYTQPVDMRKSFDGLSALVVTQLQDDPASGQFNYRASGTHKKILSWVHSRRYFVAAQERDPQAAEQALEQIGRLYQVERAIQTKQISGDKIRRYRLEHSKPIVDAFIIWCLEQCQRSDLTPKHPTTRALNYVRTRETQLRVFLTEPDVPLDTNHLDREIRTIPMGKKNWLFCWTELGAVHVGLIQCLISTCKLHGINPQTYLIDVFQRVSQHPAMSGY